MLKIEPHPERRSVTIEGIEYSEDLFKEFAFRPDTLRSGIARLFRIVAHDKREHGAIVSVHTYVVELKTFEPWQEKEHQARLDKAVSNF